MWQNVLGLSLAIVLSFVPGILYAVVLWRLDRFEREPKRLVAAVFAWGAVVATIGSVAAELLGLAALEALTGSQHTAGMASVAVVAPIVEESFKGVAVLCVYLGCRKEFDSILDGIVYAGVAALGFAATENVLYLFQAWRTGGGDGLLESFWLRVVLGAWNHLVYTACMGVGFAVARLSHSRATQLLAPVIGWVCGVALHMAHNTMAVLLADASGPLGLVLVLFVDWLGWAAFLWLIVWAIRKEQGWIAEHLRVEADGSVISRAQYTVACSTWAQSSARWRAVFRGGYVRTSRFYQVCGELALKKHQLATYGDETGNARIVIELREELVRLAPHV